MRWRYKNKVRLKKPKYVKQDDYVFGCADITALQKLEMSFKDFHTSPQKG